MIHPVPAGTRDVLPEEMRDLRALTERLRAVWDRAGYGEVRTPTLEYEDVLRLGDARSAGAGFRSFDDHGNVLALRADATIPIARLVANRYADAEPPIRLCYFSHAYRLVRIRSGQPREFLQGGLELIGIPAPAGDAEVVAPLLEALARRDLVALEVAAERLPVSASARELVVRLPQLRGGPEVLDRAEGP